MLFTRLFAAAAFVACAVAQSKLQFTTLPSNVEVGKPVPIKWTGGDGSPVTITLKKGTPQNLKTVSVLSGGVSGDSYTWTPSEDLVSGDDYALSISQGVDTVNYTGQFSVKGGTAPSASGSSSSDSATSTATVTVKSSSTVVITSVTFASTGTVVVPRNTTMVSPTLTRTGGGISAGTSVASQTSSGVAASTSSGAASNIKAQVLMGMGAFAAAALAL